MRQEDFERLYAEHAQSVLAFLLYRTNSAAVAEDLAADTFERAYRKRGLFDGRRGTERSWLYRIALNLLRDRARRVDAEQRALERAHVGAPDAGFDPEIERAEQRDYLLRAIAQLKPAERDLVALKFGGQLSIAEIAKITGEKPATVESRLYRTLRKLKEISDS